MKKLIEWFKKKLTPSFEATADDIKNMLKEAQRESIRKTKKMGK